MKNQKLYYYIIFPIIALIVISILLTVFASIDFLQSLRIVFGSVYVLFLPGLIISFIFFPHTKEFDDNNSHEKNTIDVIERIALSFALSIAIVPLAVFYLNRIGLKINLINSFFTILAILFVSGIILYYKFRKKR